MTRKAPPSVTPIAVSIDAVAALLSVSERTVHAIRRADPTFPRPVDLTGRGVCLRWLVDEVAGWARVRPRHDGAAEPPQLAGRRYRDGRPVGDGAER